MSDPIPVILCGKTTQIAIGVIAGLKPEHEVIHLCLTTESAKTEIPKILHQQPVTTDIELGSKDYSRVPRVVILGAGYGDADIEGIRGVCIEGKTPGVLWLRPDLSKPAPPLGPAYGKAMVERVKSRLVELKKEGVKGTHEEVFWY